jgi:hypothetical protein
MRSNMHEMNKRSAAPPRLRANSGPKGPPSAPPTIPPIIINPFSRQAPSPAIDPRPPPSRPPVVPPRGPGMRILRRAAVLPGLA